MSVYTVVSAVALEVFLQDYSIGNLIQHKGIVSGITNTNYFIDTTTGRYVLTLFESMGEGDLPFYLELTRHLNLKGVACPAPVERQDGTLYGFLCHRPATIITCLNGADVQESSERQCFAVGEMLARMHLATADFPRTMDNSRGAKWFKDTAAALKPHLLAQDAYLLDDELGLYQSFMALNLPSGIIHADLFKDNVLMYGDEVSGFIDFYYACNGPFVYDIAIAVNDWARRIDHTLNPIFQAAFVAGYQSIRTLTPAEKLALPSVQRAAALRFWLSRLWDKTFPMEGEMTYIKDPDVFRTLLLFLRQNQV